MKYLVLAATTIFAISVIWSCKAKQNAVTQYEHLTLSTESTTHSISLQHLQLFDTLDIICWNTAGADTTQPIRYRTIRRANLTTTQFDSTATAVATEQDNNNSTTINESPKLVSLQMIRLVFFYVIILVLIWGLALRFLPHI